ncbi:MAG: hypothetical protein WDO71_04600 [Bacteroidota bacterium]
MLHAKNRQYIESKKWKECEAAKDLFIVFGDTSYFFLAAGVVT